ncbi:cytochrome P450 [Streptomyces sp. LN699]|uniref:cytochrome P450 n=1 Tax=Streptomyces sp. LN699 TaxID=3112981 RepID=UPI00371D6F5A
MPPYSDSTVSLLTRGYAWLPDRMRSAADGVFATRLWGRPTVALRGPEAVAFFNDERHVPRTVALPDPVLGTLFGQGAGHTLDGEARRVREAMFIALLDSGKGIAALGDHVVWRWREAVAGWKSDPVVVLDETARVLALAVCDWAGMALSEADAREMAHDCVAMVDGFAAPGLRHLRARRARARQEQSLARLIAQVREGQEADLKGSALEAVAWHRDVDGNVLDPHAAAVELLNIIRPTVAVAWFAAFAAHALHRWPHHRELLRSDPEGSHAKAFAHEVRRFYPFAPFVGGLAARDLAWRGTTIRKGTLVLLDLYGHHHDAALWEHPYRFDPHRFTSPNNLLAQLIPQGGGDAALGHRRPGEDVTVTALSAVAAELARLDYEVPDQNLTIPLSRIPTAPRSGFILRLP